MKQIIYIISFALLSLAVSSCAKDELESPAGTDSEHGAKALILETEGFSSDVQLEDGAYGQPAQIVINGDDGDGPLQINDDGDDEDEERGPTK